jgi:hypothetical protein
MDFEAVYHVVITMDPCSIKKLKYKFETPGYKASLQCRNTSLKKGPDYTFSLCLSQTQTNISVHARIGKLRARVATLSMREPIQYKNFNKLRIITGGLELCETATRKNNI